MHVGSYHPLRKPTERRLLTKTHGQGQWTFQVAGAFEGSNGVAQTHASHGVAENADMVYNLLYTGSHPPHQPPVGGAPPRPFPKRRGRLLRSARVMTNWVPIVRPVCPVCESRMVLAKTVRKPTLLDYHVYECRRCAVLATVEDAPTEDYTVH